MRMKIANHFAQYDVPIRCSDGLLFLHASGCPYERVVLADLYDNHIRAQIFGNY